MLLKTFKLSFKYHKQKSYLLFFINYFCYWKHLSYHSSIINRNPTYFFLYKLFLLLKTFKLSFKYHKQKSYLLFSINYFYYSKTFKLSFMYPIQQFYLLFFYINYFYYSKTLKLSFKYHKQKSYWISFINCFCYWKHLNYHSSIKNRNLTYLFLQFVFIILKHLKYHSCILNRNRTYFFI